MKQASIEAMLSERFKTASTAYKRAVLIYFKSHNAYVSGMPELTRRKPPRTSFMKTQIEYNGRPS